ncbi:MAG: type II toxin-antitoxin system RelE/ParE family toxin [Clostridia bacterium]|nr:type II toxin-antitoxin system RelE/ParE family toxin [Clostridia bacterium]
MKWQVTFSRDALKQLKKLDKHTASLILGWIRKNLEGCENPRLHGKALTANRTGQWRYRVGDYRIIAELQDKQIVILILNVGHKRDIYNT